MNENIDQIINNFFSQSNNDESLINLRVGVDLPLSLIIVSIILSLICSYIVTLIYQKTYSGIYFQPEYKRALVLACVVTTTITMVISGNLALSLGMIGALSVVRFRSAIKDPMDIVYMFWVICIGIASGAGAFKLVLISTILISVIVYYFDYFNILSFNKNEKEGFIISISSESLNEINEIKQKIQFTFAENNMSEIKPQSETISNKSITVTYIDSKNILNIDNLSKEFPNLELSKVKY